MNTQETTNEIIKNYNNLIDYEHMNKVLESTNLKDFGKISKKTITNISKWALNGSSDKQIAENLELTQEQFKSLCTLFPIFTQLMQTSRELADIAVAGSLFQTAIGGKMIRRQQVVTIKEWDNGRVVGEHKELMWVEEELPPNPILLKYISEHKLSEKFGKDSSDNDSEVKNLVSGLDYQTMTEIEKKLQGNGENGK